MNIPDEKQIEAKIPTFFDSFAGGEIFRVQYTNRGKGAIAKKPKRSVKINLVTLIFQWRTKTAPPTEY